MTMPSRSRESEPGFDFSEDKTAKGPLKFWLGLFVAVAAGVGAWVRAEMKAESTVARVDKVETEQHALSVEQRAQRDILIRIDANVQAMKEARERSGR